MNNYPEYIEIDGEKYKINTDFRYAIQCDKIANDESIDNYERSLAIIYTLFGDKGLNATNKYEKLLKGAKKYLSCGKEIKNSQKKDMDFNKDYGYIWASMYSDYSGLDIDKEQIHWWKFMELMNGLSNSELGNCCILNKIRNGRNFDPSKIKDTKERKEFIEWQKSISLEEKEKPTEAQQESAREFFEKIGIRKE